MQKVISALSEFDVSSASWETGSDVRVNLTSAKVDETNIGAAVDRAVKRTRRA